MLNIDSILNQLEASKKIEASNHQKDLSYLNSLQKKAAIFTNQTKELFHKGFFLKPITNNLNWSNEYTVISLDGSQIYPSRHFGNESFAVINISEVTFFYAKNSGDFRSKVNSSLVNKELLVQKGISSNKETKIFNHEIDILRQITEIEDGIKSLKNLENNSQTSFGFCLLDGALDFTYTKNYSDFLIKLIEKKITTFSDLQKDLLFPLVSCTSATSSKILINLLAEDILENNKSQLNDADLLRNLLPKNTTTNFIYQPNKEIGFCYLNLEQELLKIELFVSHSDFLPQIISGLNHQILLGKGYPLALAEAHIAADIPRYEKELILQKLQTNQSHNYSAKQSSKKNLVI